MDQLLYVQLGQIILPPEGAWSSEILMKLLKKYNL